jgi:hypothetical protein
MMAATFALESSTLAGTPVSSIYPTIQVNPPSNHCAIAIIKPLLAGTKAKLLASGVKESNIVVQSVPGSWELPIACSKYVFSHLQPPRKTSRTTRT